ncbi:hypothetical protein FSP39_001645 [Pinctada imbricata]|uniref:Nucleoporin NUP42 n=1 Tax=Pinctada imbricata TaxID=66713 RepID=A0AA88Y272_PINIB|nr:hypothetical protein FSP39_001645 [Pinctada imbricata]
MLNSSQQICHYFNTKSGCRFGRNCRFSHVKHKPVLPYKEEDGSSVRGQETQQTNQVPKTDKFVETQQHEALKDLSPATSEGFQGEKRGICFTFEKYQRCRFGENCRFLHSISTEKTSEVKESARNNNAPVKQPNTKRQNEAGKKPCQFFQSGYCRKGDKCRYYHPLQESQIDNVDVLLEEDLNLKDDRNQRGGRRGRGRQGHFSSRKPVTRPPVKPKEIRKEDATEEDIKKLNKTEREQLKRRLSTNDLDVVEETEDSGCYWFKFASSDPDWPYDVKDFLLEVTIPKNYPLQMFIVNLPVDQDLPETVRRHVEASIEEWIENKEKEREKSEYLSLVFRPFLMWLDKALEDIVTAGLRQLKRELVAREAGFQFISASQLRREQQERIQASSEDSDTEEEEEEDESSSDEGEDPRYAPRPLIYRKRRDSEEDMYTGPARQDSDYEEDIVDTAMTKSDKKEEEQRKGTEMKLRNLQLGENAATMIFMKVKVVVQCARCKNKSDVILQATRPILVSCSKCNNPQVVNFRPAIMHQFSSVMGYLDLDGCSAFDLILQESDFKLGCFSCNKEMKAKSISPGQFSDSWCMSCHAKMRVMGESVKFSVLEPSSLQIDRENIQSVNVQKPKKIPKDPAIQLGNPLPDEGTCKHYKKSFRWLRFPCCGKAYPCDICHDSKEDHEMIFANRMICGHCSKEQPFSVDKPCSGCSMALTKSRTAHWEGGKGCRDRVKMSRNDPQKFSGQSKTTSKKAQEKAKPKEKKTKLRHSSN